MTVNGIFSISPTAVEVRKWLAACADWIEQDFVAERSCFCTGTVHAVDARSVQRSDVDVQTAADGGDILDILRFIGHDGLRRMPAEYWRHRLP